jgi:hypothetical protein
MSGRILLELSSPVTQSCEAVKQLIAYHRHGQVPKEMPDFYGLSGEMVLVLSNKKDAYYVVTPKPAHAWQPHITLASHASTGQSSSSHPTPTA